MNTTTVVAMGLYPEDYQRISAMAKRSRMGVRLTGKSGPVRFYYNGKKLMADQWDKDGNKHTQECMNMDDYQKMEREKGTQTDTFKNYLLPKIRADHPDWTDDEVDAYADILNEANGSIKRLIASGIDPNTAASIIRATLATYKDVSGSPVEVSPA